MKIFKNIKILCINVIIFALMTCSVLSACSTIKKSSPDKNNSHSSKKKVAVTTSGNIDKKSDSQKKNDVSSDASETNSSSLENSSTETSLIENSASQSNPLIEIENSNTEVDNTQGNSSTTSKNNSNTPAIPYPPVNPTKPGNTDSTTIPNKTEQTTIPNRPDCPTIPNRPDCPTIPNRPDCPTIENTTSSTTSIPAPQNKETTEQATVNDNKKQISVSMEIVCNLVIGNSDLSTNASLPSDGIILSTNTVTVDEDSTVFDVFEKVCSQSNINYTYIGSASAKSVYINSIASLSEKECGKYSGWKYRVNDVVAPVGCSMCKVKDKDHIKWYYAPHYMD